MAQNSFAGMVAAPRKNSLGPSLADLYFNAPAPPPGLKAYHPTLGEKAQTGLANVLGRLGVGQHQAKHLAERTLGALNALTPLGSATAASDAKRDYSQGNYLGAAANSLSALLGIVPDGGATVGKGLGAVLHAIIAPLYHGSPHKFEKFALEKIGTGEGAQAYGHGLYFAENPAVAKEYQDALSRPSQGLNVNGKPVAAYGSPEWVAADLAGMAQGNEADIVKDYGSLDAWAKADLRARGFGHAEKSILKQFRDNLNAEITRPWEKGHLYEVSLDANPEDFLNYDAPIADQPAAMEALRNLDLSQTGAMSRTRRMLEFARDGQELPEYRTTGRELLNAVSNYGENRAAEHNLLMPYGIKGVRYFDQGSRGAAQGTRNYVVYDPNIIDILSRN